MQLMEVNEIIHMTKVSLELQNPPQIWNGFTVSVTIYPLTVGVTSI